MLKLIDVYQRNKKGVSPVIATVLLIAMVIVIALIVFLWFRGLNEDVIVKFGKNVELVCGDVRFSSNYYSSSLSVTNDGTISIFNMYVKVVGDGSHETIDLQEHGWPIAGLNQGKVASMNLNLGSDVEEIILIPVLAGTSDKGEKAFVCKEKDGEKISL